MSNGIGSVGAGITPVPAHVQSEANINKAGNDEKAKEESTQTTISSGEEAAPRAELLTGQNLNVTA